MGYLGPTVKKLEVLFLTEMMVVWGNEEHVNTLGKTWVSKV